LILKKTKQNENPNFDSGSLGTNDSHNDISSNGRGERQHERRQQQQHEILQSILSDPEFLALHARQQLQVLLIIYDMLADHYKKMTNM